MSSATASLRGVTAITVRPLSGVAPYGGTGPSTTYTHAEPRVALLKLEFTPIKEGAT